MIFNQVNNTQYVAAVEIARSSFETTTTVDGVTYGYRDTEAHREQIENAVREAVPDCRNVEVTERAVVVHATPDAKTRPKAVLDGLRDGVRRFNRHPERTRAPGGAVLDGVDLGREYIEAIQHDPDARQRFMAQHVTTHDDAEHVPEADEPVLVYGNEPTVTSPPMDDATARQLDTEFIVPIAPGLWQRRTHNRDLDTSYAFEFTDRILDAMRQHLDRNTGGVPLDIEVWPSHIHIEYGSESLRRPPLTHLDTLLGVMLRANRTRGLMDVDGTASAKVAHPRLTTLRKIYVGATTPPEASGLADWLAGLPEPEPEPEPEPDDTAEDDAADEEPAAERRTGMLARILGGN